MSQEGPSGSESGRNTVLVAHVVHAAAPSAPPLNADDFAQLADEYAQEEAAEARGQHRERVMLKPIKDDESTATTDDTYEPSSLLFEETKEATPPCRGGLALGPGPTRARPPIDQQPTQSESYESLYCGHPHRISQDILVHAALSDAQYEEDRAAWLRLRREEREKHNNVPKKPVRVAYLLFLACLAVMIWEMAENDWKFEDLSVNPFFGPSVDTLLAVGAINYFKIVDNGDWWRLFTGMWLHGGIIHFLINGIVIIQLGRNLEQLHGSTRLFLVYLVSGVAAAAVSALLSPFTISVGASGALFGLLGGVWADLVQNWNIVYRPVRQLIGLSVLTVINIIVGLMPLVDNYQHLGGLITGLGAGFLLFVQPRFNSAGAQRAKRPYQALLQITGAVMVFNLLLLSLAFLYWKVDVEKYCGGVCDDLSCVNTPLWDCAHAKHSCTGTAYTNGTVFIDCYLNDKDARFEVDYPISELDNARLEDLCDEACS